ncbi:MAG: outer membrane protein OmpA-like peptidoglycan-associated protein [Cyclobacteriaceae bacterium]|jgi:outer membrane protein OmpA-like peptidoglycan-associated protein
MNRHIFIFMSALFLTIGLLAQGPDSYKKGMEYYNQHNLEKAIISFQDATRYSDRDQKAWYYLGMACNYSLRYEEAAVAFQRLAGLNPNYDFTFYYEASKALIAIGQFPEAEWCLKSFLNRMPKNPGTMMTQHLIQNRLEYVAKSPALRIQEPTTTLPEPVTPVNSDFGDYTPQVNPTGTRLYFTSVRPGGFDFVEDSANMTDFGEDIYFSTSVVGKWYAPELLPSPINSKGDDFGSAFTGDEQTMVYVRCGSGTIGNCDLYITQLAGSEWTEPVNMGNVINSKDWDSQPTISSDGNRIIFTSAREGGYGGSDLYMSEKNHLGEWGIPQNLGSTVNTPLNDNSPYLAPDGKTLYYATEGHPGFGGTDIFYCVFENGKWSKPINLGSPINSGGDDTNFSISAQGVAYFASAKSNDGNYDIYEVELPDYLKPKPTIVVQGIVTNSETKVPLATLVLIEDMNTGEVIAINKSNSVTGEYLTVLPAGRDYSVSASSKGFFFYSKSFEIPKDTSYQEIQFDIALEPIKKGTKVVLNNIFFESGRAELKPVSYVELNKGVDLLKDNKSMVIEIGGHTDNVGADALNLKLSEDRAKAVMNYMVLAGIDQSRLRSKGYGESQPIAANDTKDGKAKNRRTEFEIVEF